MLNGLSKLAADSRIWNAKCDKSLLNYHHMHVASDNAITLRESRPRPS